MAFFGVTIETVKDIKEHDGAHSLEILLLSNNMQCVVRKDLYSIDDNILYFPIDSLIPFETQKLLGLVINKNGEDVSILSGKNQNRVKTIKLRGKISQGIVSNISIISNLEDKSSEKITEFFGVSKYESPVIMNQKANLVNLPNHLSIYDIESVKKYKKIFESLMDTEVVVSEKVEGSNFSVTLDSNGKFHVNQRKYSIIPKEGSSHIFWNLAEKLNLQNIIAMNPFYSSKDSITIYGEFIGPGIQGNIYELNEHSVRFFDVKINYEFLDYDKMKEFFHFCGLDLLMVPELFRGNLKDFMRDSSIEELSHGKSLINHKTLREGVVIKPVLEMYDKKLRRVILKHRDAIYLSGTNN